MYHFNIFFYSIKSISFILFHKLSNCFVIFIIHREIKKRFNSGTTYSCRCNSVFVRRSDSDLVFAISVSTTISISISISISTSISISR